MTTAKNIFDFINSFAPFETQMSFDNSGLLIGDKNAVSDKVIVTLDVTRDVIEQAVSENVGIIISHHPVIFNPIKSLSSTSIPFLCAPSISRPAANGSWRKTAVWTAASSYARTESSRSSNTGSSAE
ncbi:MAG: Nif3-like dinuclear metal center hexameric protein, partial [Clostridia bacterium]|nr:Nif3-like dinuclear metal center hexameric protein [Clostridia bacterium]